MCAQFHASCESLFSAKTVSGPCRSNVTFFKVKPWLRVLTIECCQWWFHFSWYASRVWIYLNALIIHEDKNLEIVCMHHLGQMVLYFTAVRCLVLFSRSLCNYLFLKFCFHKEIKCSLQRIHDIRAKGNFSLFILFEFSIFHIFPKWGTKCSTSKVNRRTLTCVRYAENLL